MSHPLANKKAVDIPGFLLIFSSLALNYIPMMIISMQSNAFWLDSYVDFPFLAIPTIFFGDLLILPVFNYMFYKAIRQSWLQLKNASHFLILATIFSIVMGFSLSTFIHYGWIKDIYTGFLDTEMGKLSLAGWWHYFFTIIEIALISFFTFSWFFMIMADNKNITYKCFRKGWVIFTLFTFLNFPDYIFRQLFIYDRQNDFGGLITQLPSFSTIIFSLLVLGIAEYAHHASKGGFIEHRRGKENA